MSVSKADRPIERHQISEEQIPSSTHSVNGGTLPAEPLYCHICHNSATTDWTGQSNFINICLGQGEPAL